MNMMIGNTLALVVLMACGQSTPTEPQPLVLWPETIDTMVLQDVRCTSRPLGYTASEMASFPGRSHRLDYVNQLFRDARQLPVESDRVGRRMLLGGYEGSLQVGFEMLGSRGWTADDAPQDLGEIVPADEGSAKVWEALPKNVHQAVVQLVQGAAAARPHLHRSFDWDAIARQAGDPNVSDLTSPNLYRYAALPWLQSGGWSQSSFAALNTLQPVELSAAGATFSVFVRKAITSLCSGDKQDVIPDFESCQLNTPVGSVRVLGPGDNSYQGNDAIVIDLGGNDRYTGRVAVPRSKAAVVGVLIDLTGDDIYDGRSAPASIACGVFGIGALFDLQGDDQFFCQDSGLGCAWHGIGLLVDTGGDDVYWGHQWTQGAAHAGVGLLFDEDGNDRYTCQIESQGLGGTLGVGILVDRRGNDQYHGYDNEAGRRITFPSSQTRSHEVSLIQGAGYGRRADQTDGRSMAGGVGALVDGEGDDSYYGGVFSQGIGFWWSLGMLVDFGGNDRYRGVYFAQGASAHFALGSLVDRAGNDQYNDRGVLGQVLGAGRDGAVATMVDSSGDDVYYIPKESAGGGDMNSVGLFCDQQGKDTYQPFGYSNMGGARYSSRGDYSRNFMPTMGVFVDLSGADVYSSYGKPKNDTKWYHQSSSRVWGYGLDVETAAADPESATTEHSATSE